MLWLVIPFQWELQIDIPNYVLKKIVKTRYSTKFEFLWQSSFTLLIVKKYVRQIRTFFPILLLQEQMQANNNNSDIGYNKNKPKYTHI